MHPSILRWFQPSCTYSERSFVKALPKGMEVPRSEGRWSNFKTFEPRFCVDMCKHNNSTPMFVLPIASKPPWFPSFNSEVYGFSPALFEGWTHLCLRLPQQHKFLLLEGKNREQIHYLQEVLRQQSFRERRKATTCFDKRPLQQSPKKRSSFHHPFWPSEPSSWLLQPLQRLLPSWLPQLSWPPPPS